MNGVARTGSASAVPPPLGVQLCYAAGAVSYTVLERLLTMWLAYYYLDEASPGFTPLSASAFFGVLWVGRAVDAVSDPVLASLSDRARSALGRRRLFLLFGGAPMCACGALVFFPPHDGRAAYLALVLCLFWAAFTAYAVAYLALMAELAPTHRTRVHLATLKASGTMVGLALVFVLSPLLVGPLGFGGMVILLAATALVAAYVPVVGVSEPRYAASGPANAPLFASIRLTLADRPFRRYLISFLLFWLGFNVVTSGVPFYVRNLLGQPESAATLLMVATFGVAFVAFAGVNRLSLRLGLRRVYLAGMLVFAAVLPLLYLLDLPPTPSGRLALAIVVMGLAGLPVAGLLVIPDAIVSRLSRVAAERQGQGREAMYFGVQGFCLKLTFGLSGSLMGLLFDLFGKGGRSGVLGLKLTGPASALLVAMGLLVFWRYPGGAKEVLDERE